MRSDCQHPDCLKQDLKQNDRYCKGECLEWAEARMIAGLKLAKEQDEAVAVLKKFARKW